MNRSLRGAALGDYSKRALVHRASMHYRGIDGGRLSYADLAGLDREDLIDLILKAEYPDTGPRTEVTATTHPPVESSWPPPDTHTEG